MANLAKSGDERQFDFVKGDGSVFHVHSCEGDESHGPHTWRCDSCYCEFMHDNCPEHGGVPPIVKGREPWRK